MLYSILKKTTLYSVFEKYVKKGDNCLLHVVLVEKVNPVN